MGHGCPAELLDDVADVLAEVRTWPGVVETSRAVFYLRRAPFLHFHLLASRRRRADVKGLREWVQLDMPHPASATRRRTLLRALRRSYRERTTDVQDRRRVARPCGGASGAARKRVGRTHSRGVLSSRSPR